ncbi:hypothetical protein M758_8G025700 [Ceratodon purpureus]|uniref:F-box domain-containing protein n=1 Tax=Ceratodon purpureus TaxID=3225 RepID=A0A8T0GUN1_CERPU|nr:hypothetical protein KC19_8G026900 [Ceratodon purpureus]KAG0607407.1 hypothetical protein M758_8G025700 [Ceratodon purpureus]
MDELVGHTGEIDEGEEDALDAALDMELAATYVKHPVVNPSQSEPGKHHVREEVVDVIQEPAMSQLTFAFPGWEIGISKGEKLRMPSVSRIINDPQSAPSKKGKQVKSPTGSAGSIRAESVASDDPSVPVDGCPADSVDDDLLACVFMRLNVKDLCASMRTCRRWHRVACKEDVWTHIPLPANVPGALPRWMEVRNAGISMDLRIRFQVFRRGYEFVRSALNAWWDHGQPDGKHPSVIFRSLTQKLVINDWSLLYEAFGTAFSDRADRIAAIILAVIQRIEVSKQFMRREMATELGSGNGLAEMFSNLPSKPDGDSNASGNDREGNMWDEVEVQEVWVLVLSLWRRYKRWLMLVVSHCPELNHEVMAERARSNALATTPTVYGKGIICFRSQVILKYGVRSLLQATWSGLASAKRSGIASDNQLDLFRSADHLFQETSVLDDLTLSPTTFTQQKLRRCFGNETSSKTKPTRGKSNSTALN